MATATASIGIESVQKGPSRYGTAAFQQTSEDDHLGPLPSTVLIVGVCLAVLTVSLDCTMITTVRGFHRLSQLPC